MYINTNAYSKAYANKKQGGKTKALNIKRALKFSSNFHDNSITCYPLQRNSHLKIAPPHQTSRGKQSCSQDYPGQPKCQDRTVQAEKTQVLGSATDPPSPRFSCPVNIGKI